MDNTEVEWLRTMKAAALGMLENDTIIDVKFVFPRDDMGKIPLVRAHKFVLMARSSVFHEMFTEPGLEYVDIDDIEPDVFDIMIRFLYTDEASLTACNALPLLHVAIKYNVKKLVDECWEYLGHSLTKWNVTLILHMAVENDENDTIQRCLNFLRYGGPESFAALKRHHISRKTLGVILRDDKFITDELDLFIFCDRWAGIECSHRDMINNWGNKRQVLGDYLYLIRLATIKADDLIEVVAKSGILTEEEVSRLLNNNKPASVDTKVPESDDNKPEPVDTTKVPESSDDTNREKLDGECDSENKDKDPTQTFSSQKRVQFPISCALVDIDEEVEVFEVVSDVDWLFHGFVTRRENRLSFKEAYFQYLDINTRMMSKTINEYALHFCVQTTEFRAKERIDMFVKKNASQIGLYPSGRCGYATSQDDPNPIILNRENTNGIKIKMFGHKYSICGLIFSVNPDKGNSYFSFPIGLTDDVLND